jgi:hypothetical protein
MDATGTVVDLIRGCAAGLNTFACGLALFTAQLAFRRRNSDPRAKHVAAICFGVSVYAAGWVGIAVEHLGEPLAPRTVVGGLGGLLVCAGLLRFLTHFRFR